MTAGDRPALDIALMDVEEESLRRRVARCDAHPAKLLKVRAGQLERLFKEIDGLRATPEERPVCGHSITGLNGKSRVCKLDPHPEELLHVDGGTSWRNLPAGYDMRKGARR